MKRIISLLVTLAFVLATFLSFSVYAENGDIQTDAPGIWEIFRSIGVAETEQSFTMSNKATRADFAIFAARTIGINEYAKVERSYYIDVPEDNSAYAVVNSLAEIGVLSVPEDRLFNPDAIISSDEAIKIMVSIIGGGDYAERSGGYPIGYRRVANERKMLDGVENDNQLSVGGMFRLIYNALNAKMYNIQSIIEDDGDLYSVKGIDGETLLSLYWNIYSVEGVIDGVEEISLNTERSLSKGEISVDGEIYKLTTDKNVATNLGMYAKVFFKYDKKTDERSIIWIGETDSKKPKLSIEAEDFIPNSNPGNLAIKYYNSAGKAVSQQLEKKTTVVYNGEVINTNVSEAIKLSQGNMSLYDTDDNAQYDLVVIWDYFNTAVASVDIDGKKIYDKYSASRNVMLDSIDNDAIHIYQPDGSSTDISSISRETVLTVYKSEKSAYIYINDQSILGVCDSLYEDAVVINNVKYECDNYVEDNIWDFVTPGTKYTFLQDKFGKIADVISVDPLNNMEIGYIIGFSKGDGFLQPTKLKLFTKNNEFVVLETAEKIMVDGKKCINSDELEAAIKLGKGVDAIRPETIGQIICYKLDADGYISNIDTAYLNEGEEDPKNTLCSSAIYAERGWYTYQNMLGNDIVIDGTTLCFGVPMNEGLSSAGKKEFLRTNIDYFRNTKAPYDGNYRCEGYTIGNDKGYTDIVVFRGTFDSQSELTTDYRNEEKLYLVDELLTAVNSDDEICQAIKVYDGKNSVIYYSGSETFFDDAGIKPGDIITMRKNYYGTVTAVAIYYSYDKANPVPDWQTKGSLSWNSFLSYGNVIDINEGIIKVGYDGFTTVSECVKASSIPVLFYDDDAPDRIGHVQVGDISGLMPYSKSSEDGCSKVFVYRRNTSPICIFVYR